MNVVHLLHQHVLAEDRKRVAVMVPQRILMMARSRFAHKLPEGGIMAVLFEMVNDSAADDAVEVLQHL